MSTTLILASSIYDTAKKMEYTYIGKDYLKEMTLNYLESTTILSKPKEGMTFGEASHLLSFVSDNMQEDSLNLIMNEIGNQWGKTLKQLEKDPVANPYIINNLLIFSPPASVAMKSLSLKFF